MSDVDNVPEESGGEETPIDSILGKLSDFDDEGAAVEPQESEGEQPEDGSPEEVTAEQEESVEQEEEGQGDPEAPVIAPPDSWPAEARDKFAKLPSDLQAVIAERDAEQKSAFNRQINEAAAIKKAAETERQRLAQVLETYTHHAAMDPILAEGAQTDWAKLAEEDPTAYVQKRAAYEQRVGLYQQAQAEQQRLAEENSRAMLAREQAALAEKFPDWKDESKRKVMTQDMVSALTGRYGFSKEDLKGLVDHRTFLVALDAVRYHKLMAERKSVAEKKVVPIPKVQKPGAGGEGLSGAERVKAMKQRAAKTDNLHERAALIAAALD